MLHLLKKKRDDGTFATTSEEVANIFSTYFSTLYGQCPTFDPSVLSLLMQESCFTNLDGIPLDEEILNAIRKLNISSLSAFGIHARLWQALSSTNAGCSFIRHFVVQFWITEMLPA